MILAGPPLFTLTILGTIAVVVFSVLPRWNRVFKLSFSEEGLNLQSKYLIIVNNINNNKK
jgi:hypothetical protein